MNTIDIAILKKIIEANSSELVLINTHNVEFLDHMKSVRRFYFLNDIDGLKKESEYFLKDLSEELYFIISRSIIKLRILIREMSLNEATEDLINSSDIFLNKNLDEISKVLFVELLAVEAIVCDLLKQHELSYQKNMKAAKIAEDLGMKKKSSTLYYNGNVALNHLSPANIRISTLVESINKAEYVDDFNTQVAALTSLAQEYETLECYNLAYEECYKAFLIAKKYTFGTYNFCYIAITCSRLAINSGRLEMAKEQIKIAEVFDFNELKLQIQKVKDLLHLSQQSEGLSGDEQKLILLLTSGPKHKYELVERLYGQGEIESLNNRLKQLFLRLRKKKKGLIAFNKKESLYELMK